MSAKKDTEAAERKTARPDDTTEPPAIAVDLMAALKASLDAAKARRTPPTEPTA